MTRMNEVVGICLHRAFAAVFWGRLWFADAAACGDDVRLQQRASRPRRRASDAVRGSALERITTYAVGALRGNAAGRLSWVPHKMG